MYRFCCARPTPWYYGTNEGYRNLEEKKEEESPSRAWDVQVKIINSLPLEYVAFVRL